MLKIFIIQDKKLLIYSIIIKELDPKLFINQNRMKQQEQDFIHEHLKNASKIINSSCTSKSWQ